MKLKAFWLDNEAILYQQWFVINYTINYTPHCLYIKNQILIKAINIGQRNIRYIQVYAMSSQIQEICFDPE